MIKVNLGKVVNSVNSINALINKPIKISVAYKLSKTMAEVNTFVAMFNDRRTEISQEVDELKEKLGVAKEEQKDLPEEVKALWAERIKVLLEEEVEIPADKVKISNISDDIKIEVNHLMNLDWLLDD